MKPIGYLTASLALAAGLMMTPATAQAQNYGAIAYSPNTRAFGYSYDYGSRGQAENRAMSECQNRSRGCRVVIWFRNACGAVAAGPDGWGSAWGDNRRLAEGFAKDQCRKHSNRCQVVAWACTSR